MECKDGLWRPVAFLSKSLNEMERNYEIHDKEMLVIIRGLENQRYLLEGTCFKFEIWTDHKNLEYFMKAQKLNCRQAQWALCCGNYQTQSPMITQRANLLRRISSGDFTRELDKEPLLNQSPIYTNGSWSVLLINNPALMSILHPHSCLMSYLRPPCVLQMP